MDVDIGYSSGLEDIGQCGQASVFQPTIQCQGDICSRQIISKHIMFGVVGKV